METDRAIALLPFPAHLGGEGKLDEGGHDRSLAENEHLIDIEPPFSLPRNELHRADPTSAIVLRAKDPEVVVAAIEHAHVDPAGEAAVGLVRDHHRMIVGSPEIEGRGPARPPILRPVGVQKGAGPPGFVRPDGERGEDGRTRPCEGDLGIRATHLHLLREGKVGPGQSPVERGVDLRGDTAIGTGEGDGPGDEILGVAWIGRGHDLDVGTIPVSAHEIVGADDHTGHGVLRLRKDRESDHYGESKHDSLLLDGASSQGGSVG